MLGFGIAPVAAAFGGEAERQLGAEGVEAGLQMFITEAGTPEVVEGDEAEVLLVLFMQRLRSEALFEAGDGSEIELAAVGGAR